MITDIRILTPADNFKLTKDPSYTQQYHVNALATVGGQYSVFLIKNGSYWEIAAEDHTELEIETSIDCPNKFRSIRSAQEKINDFCDWFLDCWLQNNDD